MRKITYVGAGLAAAALATAFSIAPATADTTDVLSAGGTNAAVGDSITANNATGTDTVLSTSLGNIDCTSSSFASTVGTNPAATGTSDTEATETLTGLSASNCSTSIFGTTGVESIALTDGSTASVTVDDNDGSSNAPTLTLTPSVTAVIDTFLGQISCVYSGTVTGVISNSAQTITFTNQSVTSQTGSSVLCPSSGTYSATFGPVVDNSILTGGSATPLTVN
jgi:hypothetical protein